MFKRFYDSMEMTLVESDVHIVYPHSIEML